MGSLSHLQGIFPTQGFSDVYTLVLGFPDGSGVKNSPANARDIRDVGLIPGRKIPWRRKWKPTLVFLPGELHGQRSLADYSSWGYEESDMT